jgi:hypothetical protein
VGDALYDFPPPVTDSVFLIFFVRNAERREAFTQRLGRRAKQVGKEAKMVNPIEYGIYPIHPCLHVG